MRKIAFVILCLPILLQAAQNYHELGLHIQHSLKAATGTRLQHPQCNIHKSDDYSDNYFEDKSFANEDYNLVQKCITEICPNYADAKKRQETDQNVLGDKAQYLDKEMQPVRSALAKMINSEVKLKEAEQKWTDKFNKEGLTPSPKLAITLLKSTIDQSAESTAAAFDQNPKLDIEEWQNQTEKIYIKAGFKEAKTIAKLHGVMMREPRMRIRGYNSLGAAYRYKKQFPTLKFQDAAKKDLYDAISNYEKASPQAKGLIEMTGLNKHLESLQQQVSRATLIDEIRGKEIADTTDQIMTIISVEKFSANNPDASMRFLGEILEKSKSRKHKSDSENLIALPTGIDKNGLQKLFQQGFTKDPAQILYKNCVFNLTNSAHALPTRDQINVFESNLPKMRQNVINAIAGKYSHISHEILKDLIMGVTFFMPPAKETYFNDITESLNLITQRNEKVMDAALKNMQDAAVIQNFSRRKAENSVKFISETCEQLSFNPVRDNTAPWLGGISVGSESITNKDFGPGVVAHEIGHNIYHVIESDRRISGESRQKQEGAKKCLTSLHTPFFGQVEKHNRGRPTDRRDPRKPSHFLQEDFADVIGALSTPQNYKCEFVPEGMMLAVASNDNHSTNLFRLIHIQIASGRQAPKSCDQFLRSKNYSLNKCL